MKNTPMEIYIDEKTCFSIPIIQSGIDGTHSHMTRTVHSATFGETGCAGQATGIRGRQAHITNPESSIQDPQHKWTSSGVRIIIKESITTEAVVQLHLARAVSHRFVILYASRNFDR